MDSTTQPKVKYKTFTYGTGLNWMRGKIGSLTSNGRPEVQVSSPPEFKGQPGYWTPEDLFVGTAEMCQMLTFLAIAQKHQLPIISYKSSARGTLEFIDGQYRFTHIVIMPTVVVENSAKEVDVQVMLRDAHKRCLITNSITAVVEVNPIVISETLREAHSETQS